MPPMLTHESTLIFIGICLCTATLAGRLGRHLFGWPTLTGYLLIGLLVGPHGAGWLTDEPLQRIGVFADVAVGLILFEVGRRMDMRWLWRSKALLATSLIESLLSFAALFAVFILLGLPTIAAGLIAAIGMTTSPVILLPVISESKAEGQVSDRALLLSAGNNTLALVATAVLYAAAHVEHGVSWQLALGKPLWSLLGAAAFGAAVGASCVVALSALQSMGREPLPSSLMLFGAVALTVGGAATIDVPPLLAALAMGFACRNLASGQATLGVRLEPYTSPFLVILLVQLGATIDIWSWPATALWVIAFLVVRAAAKLLAPVLLARFNGLSFRQGLWLGIALQPMSGLTVLLVQSATALYPDLGSQFQAIVLSALVILELGGPSAVQFALRRAGESARREVTP